MDKIEYNLTLEDVIEIFNETISLEDEDGNRYYASHGFIYVNGKACMDLPDKKYRLLPRD